MNLRGWSAVGVSVVCLAIASGCSGSNAEADTTRTPSASTPSPSVATPEARERLFALGRAWLHTPAEVTYRTVGRVLGQPVTAHLCLRQMFDGEINVTKLLRTCSRRGRLVLSWQGPQRWRMDVRTPVDRFTVRSAPGRSDICRRRAADLIACRLVSEAVAVRSSGFEFLFEPPERILDAIGATDVTSTEPSQQLKAPSVECFASTGPEIHVEWCYSPDGVLLSFLRGSGSLGWESLEATTVS